MSKKIEKIFKSIATIPEYIQFIPRLDEKSFEIQKISVSEFSRNHNFTWTESVDFSSCDTNNLGETDDILDEKAFTKLLRQAKANSSKLAVCFMGKELGCGVVATADIEENAIIGPYAGVFKRVDHNNITARLDSQESKPDPALTYRANGAKQNDNFEIDAFNRGISLALFKMLSRKESLKEYFEKYGDTVTELSSVATANLKSYFCSFEEKNFLFLKAIGPIKKKTMLFFNYSLRFWEDINQRPKNFNKFGIPLPSSPEKYRYRISISPDNEVFKMARRLGYPEGHSKFLIQSAQCIQSFLQEENPKPILGREQGETEIIFRIEPALLKQCILKSDLNSCLSIHVPTPIFQFRQGCFCKMPKNNIET